MTESLSAGSVNMGCVPLMRLMEQIHPKFTLTMQDQNRQGPVSSSPQLKQFQRASSRDYNSTLGETICQCFNGAGITRNLKACSQTSKSIRAIIKGL